MIGGSVFLATQLGVSELVIGLTIIAAGTSLPEVVTSIVAAWRGARDIADGNVIGSNIFNILFVLGLCPMFNPIIIEPRALQIDFPVMLVFCLLLIALLTMLLPRLQLDRKKGCLLLGAYALFVASLFL